MRNILYFLLLTIVISCGSNNKRPEHADVLLKIDSLMQDNFLSNEPGAAIIITKEGEEIYKKAFGMASLELDVPMQPEMIFRLASVTKQFTAVSILILEERGKLNIKDDIRKYLPDYPDHGTIISIENLLTHTSGIPNFTESSNSSIPTRQKFKIKEVIDQFKDKPLLFEPGERFAYSNSGYFLLGAIIESVSGVTYESFVETEVFQKLGMGNSFYEHSEEIVRNKISGYMKDVSGYKNPDNSTLGDAYAAGGLRSNVSDLAIWNNAIHEGKLISIERLSKAFEPFELNSGNLSNYGFGWFLGSLKEHKTYLHSGYFAGFKTNVIYFPREDIFIATLANSTASDPECINFIISSILFGESNNKAFDYDKNSLAKYTGTYNSGYELKITIDEDGLFYTVPWEKGKLIARDKDEFYLEGTITAISFNVDSAGITQSLTFKHRFFGDEWNTVERIKDE